MIIEHFIEVVPIPGVKGIVEIETDEAEATVGLITVGLDVILGPVIVAEIQFCGHVVAELVDVK